MAFSPGQLKKYFKPKIQALVCRTSFPPFSWFYHAYYFLTVQAAVWSLKRMPEVSSIYLTGGVSGGTPKYGLSDIDLIIFTKNSDFRALNKNYAKLCRFFPLLQPNEAGIFDASNVATLFRAEPYLRYRFLYGKLKPRLLHGSPLVTSPEQSLPESPLYSEAVIERAAVLWHTLVDYVINARDDNAFKQSYVRNKLLRRFKEEGFVNPPEDIGEIPSSPESVYELGTRAMKNTGRLHGIAPIRADLPPVTVSLMDLEPVTGVIEQKLESFVQLVSAHYAAKIASVFIAPSQVLPISERERSLFIVEKEPLQLSEIRAILAEHSAAGLRDHIHLYILDAHCGFSLTRHERTRAFLTPFTDPATFLYLQSPESKLYGDALAGNAGTLAAECVAGARDQTGKAAAEIRACLQDLDLQMLSCVAFQELVWQSLQIKLIEKKRFIPLTSFQTCQAWAGKAAMNWLVDLHSEYRKDLNGERSETEKFFQRGERLMRELFAVNDHP